MNSNPGWTEIKSLYDGDIVIPETVPYTWVTLECNHTVTEIGPYAFNESEITSIDLPAQLDIINYHAFYYCENLQSIICRRGNIEGYWTTKLQRFNGATASYEDIPASDVFEGVDSTIPVYVPDDAVSAYKNSAWGDYFSNILPLSSNQTAIDNTSINTKAVKHIVDGQLLIEKNGKTYNATGAEVR